MQKEIKYYPYLYIFLWFLPFSTVFLKKEVELIITDDKKKSYDNIFINFIKKYISARSETVLLKTEKKTSDCKYIPKALVYFLKYFVVFSFLYLFGAFDINLDKTTFISFSVIIVVYSFFYFNFKIGLNTKILIFLFLFTITITIFYYLVGLKPIIILILTAINLLIPIHIIFKFFEDIKIKIDYYYLPDEKLIVEILKEN